MKSSFLILAIACAIGLQHDNMLALAATATFTIQPVSPQTVPPSHYPTGTTIVGQEIILGSVPARVWLEVYVTNWAPKLPRALQAVISATDDRDHDGGGFSGDQAVCDGQPTFGADLLPAFQPCVLDADCRATMSGPECASQEAAHCVEPNYGFWPPGKWCDVAFQNKCHPNWIGGGILNVSVVDESTLDFRFAIASYPEETMPDYHPSYLGTFVLDVPAGAKGSYIIDLIENETFLVVDEPPCGNAGCPLPIWQAATITIPCGRCCYGVDSGSTTGCIDGVYVADCAALAPSAVFQANEDCPQNGGPPCPACALDEHCDDGVFCNGAEVCGANGECLPGQPPCDVNQCDEDTYVCRLGIPAASNWGLMILILAFLIAGKLRYRELPRPIFMILVGCVVFLTSKASIAGHLLPTLTLQPVQPQTVPPSSYPPGTTIVGQEIILGSVPARVWFEVHISGWAPNVLKVVQAAIDATDADQDGGGYGGTSAVCAGQPANGGNLSPALVPCGGTCSNNPSQICTDNSECRTCQGGSRNGLPCDAAVPCPGGICPPSAGITCLNAHDACREISGPACLISEASRCVRWDGFNPSYFPSGYYCQPGFQNKCNQRWLAQGIVAPAAVDISSLNYRYGVLTANPGEESPDFHPSYVGTLVLDVPADAKGSYSIDFQENQTFIDYQSESLFGACHPFYCEMQHFAAKITVPCGRCCAGYASGQVECVDHVVSSECAVSIDQVFTDGELCPASGGPPCPACALDEHCDDGVFCNGAEVCGANGECLPGQPPCEDYEVCDTNVDSCAPRIPTLNQWGMITLCLFLLIAAKLTYRRMAALSENGPALH